MTGRPGRGVMAGLLLAVVAVVPGACGWGSPPSDALDSLDELPQAPATSTASTVAAGPTTSTTISATQATCAAQDLKTASYRPLDEPLPPPEALPVGSTMAALHDAGQIRVGVDETTLGLSSRNSQTGDFEGFEVDLAREIARRILPPDAATDAVLLVPVDTGKRKVDVVAEGFVDMTISAISMSCARWEDVAFSVEYLTAEQQFLVRADSRVEQREDLDGLTVCVTKTSSSASILRTAVPEAVAYPVDSRTECLVALKEGEVDAYFGHDTFLLGMRAQDPTMRVVSGLLEGEDTVSHYGIAIAHGREDLVRFVNAVLVELMADGTWAELYDELQGELPDLPDAAPPTPVYRD